MRPDQITRALREILDRHCGALNATEVVALTEAHNYIDRRDFSREIYQQIEVDHIDKYTATNYEKATRTPRLNCNNSGPTAAE